MALGGFVLGSLILYLKGMRRMMFQLSGFYYKALIFACLGCARAPHPVADCDCDLLLGAFPRDPGVFKV